MLHPKGGAQYIEIEPEELEAIAIESKRTIEIDEFVPKVTTFFGSSTNRPVIPGAWLGRDRLAGFVPWDSVLR